MPGKRRRHGQGRRSSACIGRIALVLLALLALVGGVYYLCFNIEDLF